MSPEKIPILEIGGEGGSIPLFKVDEKFLFTIDESSLTFFLSEEELEGIELKSTSKVFPSFDLAMQALLKRYPVFNLYPIYVASDYRESIKSYFSEFLKNNPDSMSGFKKKN